MSILFRLLGLVLIAAGVMTFFSIDEASNFFTGLLVFVAAVLITMLGIGLANSGQPPRR